MSILIKDVQSCLKIPEQKINKMAQFFLNVLGYPNAELSILIVSDLQILKLNMIYFNKKKYTNVISFPIYSDMFFRIGSYIIGDIVISVDTVKKESEELGVSFFYRFSELLVHGVLHLVGYDHIISGIDKFEMYNITDKLMYFFEKEKIY